MNEVLLDPFAHNSWATRAILAFCRELPAEQLTAPSGVAYGSILATLNHLVRADRDYARRLVLGPDQAFARDDDTADFDQLVAWLDEADRLWERLLSAPFDPERLLVVDRGANEVRAGVFVAQALHHGSSHREQVCAILTGLGVEPPDLQAWEYAWATRRLRERTA
jgi:uncharacterized damage-inducible protein DinB